MFEKGDLVFVPNAYSDRWQSTLTVISDIVETQSGILYYAPCTRRNYEAREEQEKERSFRENEVFKTREECDRYIENYYGDNLCRGCKYDGASGDIWKCTDCEYAVKHIPGNQIDACYLNCGKSGAVVGVQYKSDFEICKHYKPTLPQNVKAYVSWEHYTDILLNCEFNRKCRLHSESAHKTCTYEWYMNRIVKIPIEFEYEGRKVVSAGIRRANWVNQDFIENGFLKCSFLILKPQLTKSGKRKKSDDIYVRFGKTVPVDIKSGKVICDNDGNRGDECEQGALDYEKEKG